MIDTTKNNILTGHIYQGDVRDKLKEIPSSTVQTVVTSPPYW